MYLRKTQIYCHYIVITFDNFLYRQQLDGYEILPTSVENILPMLKSDVVITLWQCVTNSMIMLQSRNFKKCLTTSFNVVSTSPQVIFWYFWESCVMLCGQNT